jgi:hypothetical protein
MKAARGLAISTNCFGRVADSNMETPPRADNHSDACADDSSQPRQPPSSCLPLDILSPSPSPASTSASASASSESIQVLTTSGKILAATLCPPLTLILTRPQLSSLDNFKYGDGTTQSFLCETLCLVKLNPWKEPSDQGICEEIQPWKYFPRYLDTYEPRRLFLTPLKQTLLPIFDCVVTATSPNPSGCRYSPCSLPFPI